MDFASKQFSNYEFFFFLNRTFSVFKIFKKKIAGLFSDLLIFVLIEYRKKFEEKNKTKFDK